MYIYISITFFKLLQGCLYSWNNSSFNLFFYFTSSLEMITQFQSSGKDKTPALCKVFSISRKALPKTLYVIMNYETKIPKTRSLKFHSDFAYFMTASVSASAALPQKQTLFLTHFLVHLMFCQWETKLPRWVETSPNKKKKKGTNIYLPCGGYPSEI